MPCTKAKESKACCTPKDGLMGDAIQRKLNSLGPAYAQNACDHSPGSTYGQQTLLMLCAFSNFSCQNEANQESTTQCCKPLQVFLNYHTQAGLLTPDSSK